MNDAEARPGSTGHQSQGLIEAPSRTTTPPRERARPGRWSLLALVLAAFFAMGHLAGAYEKEQKMLKARAISAESFEVRGPDNKLAASLSRGPRGEALLSFFDQAGQPRLLLGLGADGSPIISLLNEKQVQRMALSVDAHDDTPHIVLFDDKNQGALSLGIIKGFGPGITVGKEGQGRVTISVTKDGSPEVQIIDGKRNPRISLGISNEGPIFSLLGDGGIIRSAWRVLPDGSVSFSLSDRQSRQRLIVMVDKEGKPSIQFLDPEGKVTRRIR